MRESVEIEALIWPRCRALRKPTETPVDFATCEREARFFRRSFLRRWPTGLGLRLLPFFSRPSERSRCIMAGAFMPRARRRNWARFRRRTSRGVKRRYWLAVRVGEIRPTLSQVRNDDGETPTKRATSPMRK